MPPSHKSVRKSRAVGRATADQFAADHCRPGLQSLSLEATPLAEALAVVQGSEEARVRYLAMRRDASGGNDDDDKLTCQKDDTRSVDSGADGPSKLGASDRTVSPTQPRNGNIADSEVASNTARSRASGAVVVVDDPADPSAIGAGATGLSFAAVAGLSAPDLPPLVAAVAGNCPWVRRVDLSTLHSPPAMSKHVLPPLLRLVKANQLTDLVINPTQCRLSASDAAALRDAVAGQRQAKQARIERLRAKRERKRDAAAAAEEAALLAAIDPSDIVFLLRRESRGRVDVLADQLEERVAIVHAHRRAVGLLASLPPAASPANDPPRHADGTDPAATVAA